MAQHLDDIGFAGIDNANDLMKILNRFVRTEIASFGRLRNGNEYCCLTFDQYISFYYFMDENHEINRFEIKYRTSHELTLLPHNWYDNSEHEHLFDLLSVETISPKPARFYVNFYHEGPVKLNDQPVKMHLALFAEDIKIYQNETRYADAHQGQLTYLDAHRALTNSESSLKMSCKVQAVNQRINPLTNNTYYVVEGICQNHVFEILTNHNGIEKDQYLEGEFYVEGYCTNETFYN